MARVAVDGVAITLPGGRASGSSQPQSLASSATRRHRLDVDALRRRRAAGTTLNELGAEAGVSVETLRRHLAEPASDD